MKVILTGGAGFLGYSVTIELVKQGHKIYAIVRPGSNHNERIANLPGVTLIEGDISANDYIPTWQYESCDCLIHLANQGDRYDEKAQCKNLNAGIKMLELARAAGVSRIIYAG
ncbi:MAG: NAD(P)-dependent oxidoreductase, partial [Lachnospiraceae bacterium]|nr:NAD(P)-dependent oxidoreductase [Lachnospiraceae bacterium]